METKAKINSNNIVNDDDYAVELLNITKKFGKVVANEDVTVRVKRGHVHAIIGENGAGKTTLMSVLFGSYPPTSGEIKINGKLEAITSPTKANRLGIGMVHQHFLLVDIYSAARNITLGSESQFGYQVLDMPKAIKKIKSISEKYDLHIKPNVKIKNTSVAGQQQVEIVKMLYQDADVLIFDEPTAVLTPQEIKGLLGIIRKLKDDGKTIIFISHKLQEVKDIADDVTVLRLGKVIGTYYNSTKSTSEMAELMVGRKVVAVTNTIPLNPGKSILTAKNLSATKIGFNSILGLKNFNLNVREGEIVAIAGVEGNGQTELINVITGLQPLLGGKISINDKVINSSKSLVRTSGVSQSKVGMFINNLFTIKKSMSIRKRYEIGMSHIPEDRLRYALVLDDNLISNGILQTYYQQPFSRFSFLNHGAAIDYAQQIVYDYDVRGARSGFANARALSGGNQQKFVVGREVKHKHNLLVVCQPTRGLDIGAIQYIHKQILEEKAKKRAILLVSYELSEILSLADRVIVVYNGGIVGEALGKDLNSETLGLLMLDQIDAAKKILGNKLTLASSHVGGEN